MYSTDAIVGYRIASAPIEDLLFGFALILNVMGMWEYWGAEGLQKMTSQSLSQESPFPLLA
jgi:hypothetical protein